MFGTVVMTLFLIAVLVAEHFLSEVIYDSVAERFSKEYVRRQRITFKLSALLILVYIWAITLDKDFRFIANELFWLMMLPMLGLGVWTLLGWRKK
ncbi:MAG: hypothetical protein H7Y17_03825 [Chlorobia bacterium]|nr:hypothetical protein [Fimbriimonadaceae bacterium]